MKTKFAPLAAIALTTAIAAAQTEIVSQTPIPTRNTGAGAVMFEDLSVRKGYTLSVALKALKGGRFLEFDDQGILYVSRPTEGDIIALKDSKGDGVYDVQRSIVTGFRTVHGLCFKRDKDGAWLYFTPTNTVYRVNVDGFDPAASPNPNDKPRVIETILKPGELPSGGGHWWRPILVTDTALYTGIGESENISDETRTDRQKIWRYSPDGKNKSLFASGIRNTEKLRLRPGTNEVWGIDHGSDQMGVPLGENAESYGPVTDYNPPDEFNLYIDGGFYGHPFVTGYKIPRYEFLIGEFKRDDLNEWIEKTIVPQWAFPAHSAANAFCFLEPSLCGKGKGMPASHAGDAIVAMRGSWNRRELAGYAIARVLFDNGKPYGCLNLVSSLSDDGKSFAGKFTDCVQAKDGTVLFTIDNGSIGDCRIYRLKYTGE